MVEFVAAINLPAILPIAIDLRLDWRVLNFALFASVLTGLCFGLLPAWQSSRFALTAAMKEGAGSGGRGRSVLRNALVTAQVALALLLLIVAGLVVRGLQQVRAVGPGFAMEQALALSVDLDSQGYDPARGRAFQQQLRERVAALPGVQSSALTGSLPLSLNYSSSSLHHEGQTPQANAPEAMKTAVSPRYFAAMRIPLVEGREFNEQDTTEGKPVAIVNETLARRFFPGQSALGKRLRAGKGDTPLLEIVGVAKDGKYFNLTEEPRMFLYQPLTQNYWGGFTLVVRTAAAPETIVNSVRNEVRQLDAHLPVFDVKTFDQHMSLSLFPLRVGAVLLGGFGLLALALAALGIYGVIAFAVAQRTREIGIRMALGAQRSHILRLIVRQGFWLTTLGLTAGLLASFALTRLLAGVLAGILPGVSATDAATFLGVPALLMLVALVACWIPARRATKVDPMIALRCD